LYYPKSEVSFTAKIGELQRHEARLAYELGKWKYQAALELEMRRQVEEEVNQLKLAVQETQKDNKKLEDHIQQWKLIAEKSQSCIVNYRQGMDRIFGILKDLKSGPPSEKDSRGCQ
jgi:hypothetical protein